MYKIIPLLGLAFLLFLISCKPEPQVAKISYKHTENIVYDRLETDVGNLFPLKAGSARERHVFEQVYNYLISYDSYTRTFVPELLTSIPDLEEVEEGIYAYKFEILPEAVWADGSPVTGNDYLATIKLVFHPNADATAYIPYLDHITDITAQVLVMQKQMRSWIAFLKPWIKISVMNFTKNYKLLCLKNSPSFIYLPLRYL